MTNTPVKTDVTLAVLLGVATFYVDHALETGMKVTTKITCTVPDA
jgi:hypothetical protein